MTVALACALWRSMLPVPASERSNMLRTTCIARLHAHWAARSSYLASEPSGSLGLLVSMSCGASFALVYIQCFHVGPRHSSVTINVTVPETSDRPLCNAKSQLCPKLNLVLAHFGKFFLQNACVYGCETGRSVYFLKLEN